MTQKPRLIFMGTPAFSAGILESLIHSQNYTIASVYTQPPRPQGRGKKVTKSHVHRLAELYDLPVETPISLKPKADQLHFKELAADMAVVVAYGLLLPKEILEAPRLGCMNIHTSHLPRWRGAAPIQHTIWAGDTKTAVCFMKMDEGLDTGPIYQMMPIQLTGQETSADLYREMERLSIEGLADVLPKILSNQLEPKPQSTQGQSYAPKITKEMAKIDWHQSAVDIERQVRALNPNPVAWFRYENQKLKLYQAHVIDDHVCAPHQKPATILSDSFDIACGAGMIRPVILQKPGGKPMNRDDFLRGFKIHPGTQVK